MTGRKKLSAKKVLLVVVLVALPPVIYYGRYLLPAPDTHFDIYVLGGSTAKGRPYNPAVDLGKLVSHYFDDRIDGRPVRVFNLAEGGGTASLAYRRSRKIRKDADLVLLYSGNNEFLTYDRKHDLSERPRAVFDVSILEPDEWQLVLDAYEQAIERTILRCRKKGVPLVLSTVAVNNADVAPNRSELADPANAEPVRELLDLAQTARSGGDCDAALESYDKIVSLEPGFALAHYLAAQCLREQGAVDRARDYYHRAQDLDVNPYRVLPVQNEMLRQLAAKHDVPLVDAVAILERGAPDGLVGYDLMWDNCHPTLEGYALIAHGFVEHVEALFGVRSRPGGVDFDGVARRFAPTREQEFEILVWTGQFMYRYSTLVWDPVARLARADHYLERANALIPETVEYLCAKATLSALRDDRDASVAFWRRAYAIDPEAVRERLENRDLRRLLKRVGFGDVEDLERELDRRTS